ncbi:MAG TPA: YkgJ family cysteine cluster protein [Methanoregulaceae archaeon]|nr:YkgJ family cysteine cluster protein [Methanoregulaceae archaeon]
MKISMPSPSERPDEPVTIIRFPRGREELPDIEFIASKIKETGFSCIRCGSCCRQESPDSNQVMVTATDLRAIRDISGLSREDFCDPFPGVVRIGEGLTCTFNWELKRTGDECIFLSDSQCKVYQARPWICRTYPFKVTEGMLEVFPCPGTGTRISEKEARKIAMLLIERYRAESFEETAIRDLLVNSTLPATGHFVADSEGIWENPRQ